jgi:type IV pilus assembly protein PilV
MSIFLNRPPRGISLVEVLVALVVLSVGLLGVAALLVTSVQGTRTALYRTQAVNLVSDMADRIRANSFGRAAYGNPPGLGGCQSTVSESGSRVVGTRCASAVLAADDLERWRRTVRATFPNVSDAIPAGTVQFTPGVAPAPGNPGTPDTYRITLTWQEPPSDQSGAPNNDTDTSNLLLMPR